MGLDVLYLFFLVRHIKKPGSGITILVMVLVRSLWTWKWKYKGGEVSTILDVIFWNYSKFGNVSVFCK